MDAADDKNRPAEHAAILALASSHGLDLSGELDINELGLDFRIVTARDADGMPWVLRIPRRKDVVLKIEREAAILAFMKTRLPIAVPDWRIVTPELVAYPLLTDPAALAVEAETMALTWNIDPASEAFAQSLAVSLAALHAIPAAEAVAAGLEHATPEQVRQAFATDLDTVKHGIGLDSDLEHQYRSWLDDDRLWPDFSVPVHGDLYAGHILVDNEERVSGIIDWTEAQVSDPSIDFSGHFMVFGEHGLKQLLAEYYKAGGKTWATMAAHVRARSAAAPIAYATFALGTGDDEHLAAARSQLGVR